jgi:hypothetical protein
VRRAIAGVVLGVLALVGAAEAADKLGSPTPSAAAVAHAWRAKIFVSNDEWPLSDYGFAVTPDARRLALNVAAWFTDGRPGTFLVYSQNGGLTGASLAATMRGAGHTWHVTTAPPFTLHTLLAYDAVFVGGGWADAAVLADYVRAGGKVFVVGGTGLGNGTAAVEADYWNGFLNAFGLHFTQDYNFLEGVQRVPAEWTMSPLFAGVAELYYANGESVAKLDPMDGTTQVFTAVTGMFATHESNVIPLAVEACPKRFPATRGADIIVTVSGGAGFDVATIDPASLRIFGVAPGRSSIVSLSARETALLAKSPFAPCVPVNGAAWRGLVLTFSASDVADAIAAQLGHFPRNDETALLLLSGRLKAQFGGTPVAGEDIVSPFSNRSARSR